MIRLMQHISARALHTHGKPSLPFSALAAVSRPHLKHSQPHRLATMSNQRENSSGGAARQEPAASSVLPLASPKRPKFHLQPEPKSWLNDPNGIHYDPATGLYHLFYQHFPTGGKWSWGLSWGHACSLDLKNWYHLPPILHPTPGYVDEDGVWSGCAFPTEEGTVILNTAVRKREKAAALGQLPPPDKDMGFDAIETQTYAVSLPEDPLLRNWRKGEKPLLEAPPFKDLTGWRDPFLIGRPGDGLHDCYTMMIGSGFSKGTPRGTCLVYTSHSPIKDWRYEHELCIGDGKTGSVWECPLLAKVPQLPRQGDELCSPGCEIEKYAPSHETLQPDFDWALVVSPENSTHAPVYWLGNYDHTTLKFDLDKAYGPIPVDLGGCTYYAPNICINDPKGRLIMWGWCQETGRPEHATGEHEFGSCMSVPRLLWRHPRSPGRLWQEPLPSITELRQSEASWWEGRFDVMPGQPFPLPPEIGQAGHVELEVTFDPPVAMEEAEFADGATAVAGKDTVPEQQGAHPEVLKSGIIFHAPPSREGQSNTSGKPSGLYGAALIYDWREERLDVVYSNGRQRLEDLCALPYHSYVDVGVDVSDRMAGAVEEHDLKGVHRLKVSNGNGQMETRLVDVAGTHIVGSKLRHPLDEHGKPENRRPVTLRIFLDHSLLEVFTCTGEVLTCRIYREVDHAAGGDAVGILPAARPEATIELASFGAPTPLTHIAAHKIDEMWEAPDALHRLEQRLKETAQQRRAEAEQVAMPEAVDKKREAEMAEAEARRASEEAQIIDEAVKKVLELRERALAAPEEEATMPAEERASQELQVREFMTRKFSQEGIATGAEIHIHKYMQEMCASAGICIGGHEHKKEDTK